MNNVLRFLLFPELTPFMHESKAENPNKTP